VNILREEDIERCCSFLSKINQERQEKIAMILKVWMSFGKIGDCDKHNDREGVGCGQMSMRRFSDRDECIMVAVNMTKDEEQNHQRNTLDTGKNKAL